jgi:NAD(P)-dependent dehydrogenase (short-subunit alcohol dehydrogenase family)
MQISGVSAIVTGGATGLGAAISRRLAAMGARVAILGRRAELVRRAAEEFGALALPCDVTEAGATEAAFAAARAAHGPVRILVNCAAITRAYPLIISSGEPASMEGMQEVISVNLLGTLNTVRIGAPEMARAEPLDADGSRGVIINVSSINADYTAIRGAGAYVASKGAINALTHVLANELGGHGIRVVTLSAGAFETENLRNTMPAEAQAYFEQAQVFPKRLGDPDEFAGLVVHVCENNFINGVVLRITGGVIG